MSSEQVLREYPWLSFVNVPGEPVREMKVSRVSLDLLVEKSEGHQATSDLYTVYHFFDGTGGMLGHASIHDSHKALFQWILELSDKDRAKLMYIGKECATCSDGVVLGARYTLYKRTRRMSINSMVSRYESTLASMVESEEVG